jgi:hypothetical protein
MPLGTVLSTFLASAMVKDSTSVANFSITYARMTKRMRMAEGSYMRFAVPTARRMLMVVVWVVMLYVLVGGYQHFGETYCLHLQPLSWKQYVPPKRWYLPTSPHDITIQKTTIDASCNLASALNKSWCLLFHSHLLYLPQVRKSTCSNHSLSLEAVQHLVFRPPNPIPLHTYKKIIHTVLDCNVHVSLHQIFTLQKD